MSRLFRLSVCLIAAWSGFFVMSVELLGGRLLAPYFGSSIFVWGGIITVFMTCLSVGYLIGGRLSLNNPSLTRLGWLIFGEAMLSVPIVAASDVMLEALSYQVPDPRYGSLLGAAMLFGLPTIISGTISPYAVRLLIGSVERAGNAAGFLYFASTLGSAAGTVITSFYLVLYFEIDTIITALILLSAGLGLSVVLTGRAMDRRTGSNRSTVHTSAVSGALK